VEAINRVASFEGIDLSASYAYSDSATDIPFLEAVGHPVAVNPERELRIHAEENDWPVLEFQRPVSLRGRLSSSKPFLSGAILTAGVAAAIMLARRRTPA
jgi:hypothetical protein